MADKYDDDIAEIMRRVEDDEEFTDVVDNHWTNSSPLFQFVTPSGECYGDPRPDGQECGCLTMIRGYDVAWTNELTEQIRSDERLPNAPERITPEHLPVFAEWQRRIDKEIRQPA